MPLTNRLIVEQGLSKTMTAALAHVRADYDTQAGKSLFTAAGATVWAAAGISRCS